MTLLTENCKEKGCSKTTYIILKQQIHFKPILLFFQILKTVSMRAEKHTRFYTSSLKTKLQPL